MMKLMLLTSLGTLGGRAARDRPKLFLDGAAFLDFPIPAS